MIPASFQVVGTSRRLFFLLALDSAKRQEPVLIKHRKAKDSTGKYRDHGRIRVVVISVRTRNPTLGPHPDRKRRVDYSSYLPLANGDWMRASRT